MKSSDLSNLSIEKNYLIQIINNNEYNKTIIDYYFRHSLEYPGVNFGGNAENIANCNRYWTLDYYKEQKIKDFKRTNLCKDKFCNNCKIVKQASRLAKFMPMIEELSKDKYLYHMVLTVPNCKGSELKETIREKIFKNFYILNRYLKLEKSIKGLDFEKYGYEGSIRSLEITFKGDDYHPHLHCIIALNNQLDDNRYIKNTFSKSRKNGYRKFTDFEILIQKIWYLLNNGLRVTKRSIDDLEIGYSCTVDSVDRSSVFEVFKYMTKSTDEKGNLLTYENFKVLREALYRVRQIQGYGCFYNVVDDDSIIDEADDLYNTIVELLKAKEDPLEVCETPEDLLNDNTNKIISRKIIFRYLREIYSL